MLTSPLLEKLIQHFNRFPGIGRKTAQRLVWHLISSDKTLVHDFAESIKETVDNFTTCGGCLMLSEADPCSICADTNRNDNLLCIVETTSDVYLMENMHEFQGKYFVLGHLLSPLEGYGLNDLHMNELETLIRVKQPQEVILALKPSAEGEATIHYISELLQPSGIAITRLSTGIPFGSDLEYTSALTLANAWKRRYRV